MVAMKTPDVSPESQAFFNEFLSEIRQAIQAANRRAEKQGIPFVDYASSVSAALDIVICEFMASRSLAGVATDPRIVVSLVEGRVRLAQEMVGESLRDALEAFAKVCGVMNREIPGKAEN